jgi:Icc protein
MPCSVPFPQVKHVDGFIQGDDDLDGVRLLYLDTLSGDGKHHGELCQSRMRWVADQIRSVGETPLLIFLHHPPCDIGVPAFDRLRLLDSDDLADLVRRRSGPTHVFCGHVHRNVSGLWAGSPFAALKSLHSQFDLDMASSKLVRSDEPPGFAVILIGQSDIVVNYRDLSVF